MEDKDRKMDIDEIIKSSYKNVQIPKEIFEKTYEQLDERKNNTKVIRFAIGIAASIILVLIVVAVITIPKDNNTNDTITPTIDGKEEIESNLPVASDIIYANEETYQPIYNHLLSPVGMSLIEEETQFVVVVKIEKIVGYTNYIKKTDEYLSTPFIISKAKVEKVFKGDLSGEIEMMSYGGVISVSDYIKSRLPGQSIDAKYQNLTDEEKENTFVKICDSMTMATIEPDVGKYYLVFMNYNENLESYQVLDDLIYEYDIDNDMTKNTETNEWEEYEFGRR